ncbi:peptidoglycan-binding protein [Stappia indica]|uniref:peptidoglycan-binding protein n=1 Tax=Stappia indica TaxID=538381 RepID=UPI001D1815E7|nr:peptidoglycan-binding protein [Stappia indica]MCC4243906.1 peptidoglycan-binding protein [Stappia indica]
MSWNARHRSERGLPQEDGYGREAQGEPESWYEPRRRAPAAEPQRGDRARAREQLNDVADALGRLMDAPQPAAAGNRQARRAAAARARNERPAAPAAAPSRAPAGSRSGRIEAVLSALDRLDRRVEDMSHEADAEQRSMRPARAAVAQAQARAPRRPAPPQARDEWSEDWRDEAHDAPRDARREASYDTRHAAAYDEREPEYDDRPHESYEDAREAAAAPRGDWREAHEDEYRRPSAWREERAEEDLRPLIRDLAQRVDRASGARDDQLGVLRREIADLRGFLTQSLRAERERTASRDTGEMRRLSDAVERLRADRGDMRLVREVRAEISDLRSMIGQSNVEGMLQTLESGYAHLVQRLDEMSRDRLEPRLVADLGRRLADIEDAFRIVPRGDQLAALDDRVADIGHRVEELVRRSGGADLDLLRGEIRAVRDLVERFDVGDLLAGIDERMSALSQRFDTIDRLVEEQRHLAERMGAIEHRLPKSGAVDRLQDRLEEIASMLADDRNTRNDPQLDEKLGEIAGRLKRIENARQMPPSYDAAFTLLEKRLAAIDGKINALDRPDRVTLVAEGQQASIEADLIARLEAGIANLNERFDAGRASAGGDEFETLRREIASLRDSVSQPVSVTELEAQLRDLAEAVNRGAASDDAAVLSQVEDKIAALAAKLDAADSGFARLGEIQNALQSGGAGGGDVAQALRGDLHRLMEAATSSERRARESMDSVQDVLASINNRLMALEQDTRVAMMPAPGPEDDRPLEPGSGKPRVRQQAQPRMDAPVMPRAEMPSASAAAAAPVPPQRPATRPAGARPAAPMGAARPSAQPQEGRDRKADFIAAARRAAQAASEEVNASGSGLSFAGLTGSSSSDDKPRASAAGWLRSKLGRGKAKDKDAPEAVVAAEAVEPRPLAGDRREGPRSDAARSRREELAEDLRADMRAADPVEAEDGATEDKGGRRLFSAGGRRAVMLAAAAVIIAVGALQIFKLVSPSESDVASLQTPPTIEATTNVPAVASADTGAAAAGAASEAPRARQLPSDAPSEQASPPPAATSTADAGASNGMDMPDLVQGGPAMSTADVPPAAAEAAPASEPGTDLAFAPPAVSGNAFSTAPGAIPGTIPGAQFQTPGSAPASLDLASRTTTMAPAGPAAGAAIGGIPAEAGPVVLRQAAAGGDPAALFAIAVNYTEGTGVQPDLKQAASYYRKAADAGLAPAQYRLGSLYEKGRGVEKNLETARDWYRRAAEQGNAKAAHNLAVLYAEGLSGTPEFNDASYWFKKAANFGLADSQYNLGILYARGLGLEKNLVESYKWFALAARQGDRDAGNKRDELANMLSREQLAEARIAVETWKEAPRAPAANQVEFNPAWSVPAEIEAPRANVSLDPREMVMNAQKLLAERGFDPGTPDGQIGPRTREAVRAFQQANGLPVTGAISADLVKALTGENI